MTTADHAGAPHIVMCRHACDGRMTVWWPANNTEMWLSEVLCPCGCHQVDDPRADLIGVTEAAGLLGVTRARVVQMVHEGKLASWRIGSAIAVSRTQVLAVTR